MRNNMRNRIKKYLLTLLVLLFAVAVSGCAGNSKTLDFRQYIKIETEGFSGRADAKLSLDRDGILNALSGEKASDSQKLQYKTFVDSIACSMDKVSELSNGDVIKICVTYDVEKAKELKIEANGLADQYTVSGLDEGVEIDVFKDLELIVSGTAPYGFVTYVNRSKDEFISQLSYDIDYNPKGISNGDIITIRCNIDLKAAAAYKYYTDDTVMTYTVDGLDSYIYSPDEMDRNVLSDIAGQCAEVIKNATEDTTTRMLYTLSGNANYLYQDNNEWVDFVGLKKVVMFSKKDMESSGDENVILFVFGAVVSNNNYSEDGYFIFSYSNAVLTADGEFVIASNNPELRYKCGQDEDALYSEVANPYTGTYEEIVLDGVTLNNN